MVATVGDNLATWSEKRMAAFVSEVLNATNPRSVRFGYSEVSRSRGLRLAGVVAGVAESHGVEVVRRDVPSR
jgi:phage shock protein PspC (stress-responsive transcriptional regulator)